MLKQTPFHTRTSALMQGYAWRRWAGFAVASSYDYNHDREYAAIRNSAALLDISPLYKYMVTGRDAALLLDRVVTRDVAKSKLNQVLYTPWCDAAGKVLDDGTISRLEETVFRLTSAEPNLRWLEQNAVGMQVEIRDVSDSTAALALQGPTSREILRQLTQDDVASLKFFRLMQTRIRDIPVTISRTGYTGDLGYEIWVEHDRAVALWDALIDAGSAYGIVPTGILALDVARIEAGLLLLDVDYVPARRAVIEQQTSSPFELSLDWTVSLEKATPFVGRHALVREAARAPAWRFVGVEVDWDSLEALYQALHLPPKLPTMAWRTSVPLYRGGKQIGYATSGCWSPLLKKYLALAHVEGAYAAPGTALEIEMTVEHRRKRAAATVRPIPFFNPERKRG
jgi:aminomethyltransferase